MRPLVIVSFLLASVALTATAHAQRPALEDISLTDYLGELDRIRGQVERLDERQPDGIAAVLARLPRGWQITLSDQRCEASADWIRRELADWRTKPDAATRTALIERLRAVRAGAAQYAVTPRDANADRRRLLTILEAREFQDLKGPSWLDRQRQRAMRWLVGLLTRALGSSAIPTITNFLVYAAIALVLVLVAAWTYRSLRASAELDSIKVDRIPRVARPWAAWLDDARAAAARGEWPESIHLAYWCGIAFLEARGAWRPDRSRTPREYLRVLGASHEDRPALQALTRELEQVWYGARTADASRFDDALAQLKRLGCPSL